LPLIILKSKFLDIILTMRYTPKQIEKYKRQKYISSLEKVTKNLFKMFRNSNVTQSEFLNKFKNLKENLDKNRVTLYSEYYEQVQSYINNLYKECQNEFDLEDIRAKNMTHLNRLQKLKNKTSYKKDKHKNRDWA